MKIHSTTVFIFFIFIVSSFQCRLLTSKGSLLINEDSPFRCGTFFDQHFENKIKSYIYPDLGLVLANGVEIGLDERTINVIQSQAKNCFSICTLEKRVIYEKLNMAKQLSKQKKKLNKVVPLLQEVESLKKEWLTGHRKRYLAGVRELNFEQLQQWLFLEQFVSEFPSNQ